MEEFMHNPFSVKQIDGAVFVGYGQGRPVHKNRPYHGIVIQEEGACRYDFENGRNLLLEKNAMIYLPRGASYRSYYAADATPAKGRCYAINFTLADSFVDEPFLFKPAKAQPYLEHFRNAVRARKMRRPGDDLKSMAELYAILSAMQAEYAAYVPKSKTAIIQPALNYIAEHYCEEHIGIAELSELCSVSEPYFRRVFQACMGTSPRKYISSRKIERACELLRFGEYSVRAAAELCGYADECYFSREFKKALGVSPAAYARTNEE